MSKPKEYHIDTFDKLCNVVNDENAEILALDLANWLLFYNKVVNDHRKEYPEQTDGKINTEIIKSSFKWIDDGKQEIKGVELHNVDNGEVIKIPFEKPL